MVVLLHSDGCGGQNFRIFDGRRGFLEVKLGSKMVLLGVISKDCPILTDFDPILVSNIASCGQKCENSDPPQPSEERYVLGLSINV